MPIQNQPRPVWQADYEIRSYDVDVNRAAKLSSLCRFMQETAWHHAENLRLGDDILAGKSMAWVLARQHIQVGVLPAMGETVTVSTWACGTDRLFFHRDFKVTDSAGADCLLSTTSWFVIDLETRQPRRANHFQEAELPLMPALFEKHAPRLRPVAGAETKQRIPVTYSDLDFNGHVTNVRYIEWVLDSFPLTHHRENKLKELQINIMAEAFDGETVSIHTAETAPLEFSHSANSGREILRARTVWESNGDNEGESLHDR